MSGTRSSIGRRGCAALLPSGGAQGENRRMAVQRLRLALATEVRVGGSAHDAVGVVALALPEGADRVQRPARDFPALLSEALDALSATGWRTRPAAEALGVNGSQLSRFVREHRPAWERLNRARAAGGLSALR